MQKVPEHGILDNAHETQRFRTREIYLGIVYARCSAKKGEEPSHTRLKDMVHRFLD